MVGEGIGRELLRKNQRALVNRCATVGADDPMQVRKVPAAGAAFPKLELAHRADLVIALYAVPATGAPRPGLALGQIAFFL